jgi:hypothetical protein
MAHLLHIDASPHGELAMTLAPVLLVGGSGIVGRCTDQYPNVVK